MTAEHEGADGSETDAGTKIHGCEVWGRGCGNRKAAPRENGRNGYPNVFVASSHAG